MNKAARSRQIRQIKAASASMFDGDEDAMRDCYEQVTGQRFCRDMADAELRQLGNYLAKATGHKPQRKVTLRPGGSLDLAEMLAKYAGREPPGTWRENPLKLDFFYRRVLGRSRPASFEHLTRAEQDKLHRACRKIWGE